jgi:hypothetical protein
VAEDFQTVSEGAFCELRQYGVLGSWARNLQKFAEYAAWPIDMPPDFLET